MINILIADNQPLTQQGIITFLTDVNSIHIVGKCGPEDLEAYLSHVQPQLIIISHEPEPNSNLTAIKKVKEKYKSLCILVLSNNVHKHEIMQVIDQGINNYISKGCSRDEFLEAVFATANGEKYYCKKILNILFGPDPIADKAEAVRMLSLREKEIIELIATGMGNKDIAEKLFLSIHTVKTHRKNIIKKLGFTFKHASELILIIGYLNDFFI
ncbi:response regulator transcription factor [Pedobacter sp. HMWF019]|uniref:LuxR C-terminal-related transcriptional regulator n=1 Tax=Pedobacter sp. HMWF019 TaxID=2056856 RepID=UPI001304A4BE|nr:response regulator transcription factor [Pedobacter sp. HMWF019]